MLKLKFKLVNETKTCYRFETGARPDMMTLYLKKAQLDEAGIMPENGVVITVEQAQGNDDSK